MPSVFWFACGILCAALVIVAWEIGRSLRAEREEWSANLTQQREWRRRYDGLTGGSRTQRRLFQ